MSNLCSLPQTLFINIVITAARRAQVAKFFKPSLDAILEAVKNVAGDLVPKKTVTSSASPDSPTFH